MRLMQSSPIAASGNYCNLSGTPAQIEWAERIRVTVDAEFDRVANAFARLTPKQPQPARSETESIIALLREKQHEVLQNPRAGYFICEWQELTDQVRHLIFLDPRYQAIRARQKTASESSAAKAQTL